MTVKERNDMKPKAVVKIAADIMMTLALLFLMGYQFWGDMAHEWAGAGMFVLFALHHILNLGWLKARFRGKYPPVRVLGLIVNDLLLAAMLCMTASGIIMSRYVFAFLPISGGMSFARLLHMASVYWGFILMSVHLGMHWNLFLGMARKRTGKAVPSKHRSLRLPLMGLLIAAYGAFVFVDRDFPIYLFLRSEFVFLDYEEPVWSFYLDYLCLMGLWMFLAHYLSKGLRKPGGKKKAAKRKKRLSHRWLPYPVFFFFNPFSEEVFKRVIDRILKNKKEDDSTTFIYHNPQYLDVLEGRVKRFVRDPAHIQKTVLHDKRKNYDTCILNI